MLEKSVFRNGIIQSSTQENPVYNVSTPPKIKCKFDKPKGCIISDLCDVRGNDCRHRTAYCQLIGETEENYIKFLENVGVPS